MKETLFGFIDSYVFFITIGVLFAVALAIFYCVYIKKFKKIAMLDLTICSAGAVLFGFIFALLFQNLYTFIDQGEKYKWTWSITFYGGLFGGVLAFLAIYYIFFNKKKHVEIGEVYKIAPACVTLAHAFGRIGCFMGGCCYGMKTDSWIGVKFPFLNYKVIPTQLIESVFLFLLTAVLLVLLLVFEFKYTPCVYFGAYGVFRFIIEFFRGDYRGGFVGALSPSQIWSIVLVVLVVPTYFLLKKFVFKEN